MPEIILEMSGITKEFSGVKALSNVELKVMKNEIHAICGENGAGKSTLMNILSGVYPYGSYEGNILYNEEICKFKSIKDSEELGIAIIHQELALSPYLSIAENIFLGNEQADKFKVINWYKTTALAKELMDKVGLKEKPATLVSNIGVGKQQLVEIAKALSKDVKILILDEPTAALNEEESNKLLDLMLDLQKHGLTLIMISHKLNEITKVCNSITILRDGKTIETLSKEKDLITEDRIIKGMIGRELENRFPKRDSKIGEVCFEVKDWTVYDPNNENRQIIKSVNFNLKKGEVLGFAGLMGAGRTEIAMSIFGKSYGSKIHGQIFKDGKEVKFNNVTDAVDEGIAYVSEDRKTFGLVLINDIRTNISLPNLAKLSNYSVIDSNKEIVETENYRKKLNIKSSSITQLTGNLSGGNQQKVVLSKWIMAEPDVLILDEPTRGIDVGAKYEIYQVINELVSQGKSIIMISSEMPELLGMSDRVYVVNEGKIVGEFDKEEVSQEKIMKCIIQNNWGVSLNGKS